MKKQFLMVVAVALAFTLSAFTSEKETPPPYYWHNGTSFVTYSGSEACAEGTIYNCVVTDVGDGSEQLYKTQSFSQPLKYN